jgi:hypothetical protein
MLSDIRYIPHCLFKNTYSTQYVLKCYLCNSFHTLHVPERLLIPHDMFVRAGMHEE